MKGNKKTVLVLAALAAAAVLMLGLWWSTQPKAQEGDKTVIVEVVHGDQSSKEFTYRTDAQHLGPLLTEEGLIQGEQGAMGLFILTADGETAQGSQWWCITKGGAWLDTGVDKTPIADGDHFELTLKRG